MVEELLDHVAVGAQHRGLVGDLLDQSEGLGERRPLGEGRRRLDREAETAGERLDRLAAAHERARHDPGDAPAREQPRDPLGLAVTHLAEGPLLVGTVPTAAAARLRVADEEDRCRAHGWWRPRGRRSRRARSCG